MINSAKDYAISAHKEANCKYDGKPYETHLQLVVDVIIRFIDLIPSYAHEIVICGGWVHDLIEDARQTYNDVKNKTNTSVANLAYALTNEKGKTRKERANDKYYQGIRETEFATFIKLADRIANVEYSKKTKSRMFDCYKKENSDFVAKLYDEKYKEMFDHLNSLFN